MKWLLWAVVLVSLVWLLAGREVEQPEPVGPPDLDRELLKSAEPIWDPAPALQPSGDIFE